MLILGIILVFFVFFIVSLIIDSVRNLCSRIKASKQRSSRINQRPANVTRVSYSRSADTFVDTLEQQSLYYCIARFIGAISTLRTQSNSWRSSFQGGSIGITQRNDGLYDVDGFYDHDSNYGVESALRGGGYLDYLGMKYVDDGLSYHIKGIDQRRSSSGVETNRMFITHNYIVSKLKERFGMSINIEAAYTKDSVAYVSFNFPE